MSSAESIKSLQRRTKVTIKAPSISMESSCGLGDLKEVTVREDENGHQLPKHLDGLSPLVAWLISSKSLQGSTELVINVSSIRMD